MRTRILAVLALVIPVAAEKADMPREGLEKTATHIVVGEVRAIYTRQETEGDEGSRDGGSFEHQKFPLMVDAISRAVPASRLPVSCKAEAAMILADATMSSIETHSSGWCASSSMPGP